VARAVRIEYGGAFYHVMVRGNRRERIFRDEADRLLFYQTLGEACERTGWRGHAWVLMSNHYHLMVETPEANLVAAPPKANRHAYCGFTESECSARSEQRNNQVALRNQ
jgi:REP element-mobilizing transposase RayT